MKPRFFIDIHAHPSIKSYARSFKTTPVGQQVVNPENKTSLWYRDAPGSFNRAKNRKLGLTNFIQSDAQSLAMGKLSIVFLSFYPQEKGFFDNKAGHDILSDLLTNLATEFGRQRIKYIQRIVSYWEDLKGEMDFLKQGADQVVDLNGEKLSYSIATSYQDIEKAISKDELGYNKIIFVPTIEGGHVFDQVMDSTIPWNQIADGIGYDKMMTAIARVYLLRAAEENLLKPLFITVAHHFWNGICGQARSLGGIVKCVVDQKNGLEEGITTAGYRIIREMIRPMTDSEGKPLKPILVDIKHMSRKSRLQYFLLRKEYHQQHIPIVASHGGVTGLSAPDGTKDTPAAKENLFMTDPINFFDDEILEIEASQGLLGIQLDERRIGSAEVLQQAKNSAKNGNERFAWAKPVWNQIRHMAELLDQNDRFAWGIQCLGTDFDGIIDPIDGYWTASNMDELYDHLMVYASDYLAGKMQSCPLKQSRNKNISADDVVSRVMTGNALALLSTAF